MKLYGKILFPVLLLISIFISAQSPSGGTGPREKSFRQDLKSNKQIRLERREKRKLEKAEQKAIRKHHKRIQTKAVQKRMKTSKKKSKRYNDNKREFFLKRWIRKWSR